MRRTYGTSESLAWKRARRAAFVRDIVATFTQRPESLLSFDHVCQKLKLDNVHYRDLRVVSLDHIVGSVGRYTDFTRAFLPRQDSLQDRWQRIEQMVATGRELPPIELYQVGHAYFVRDGNHRVSVARQCGITKIKAYVWEYDTPVPLQPDSDVDDLLCRTAHAAFLERTRIDHLRPDLSIKLTQPDGYEDLLCEIEAYQQILSEVDRRELSSDEAVTLWCDLRYGPIVAIIRERYALQEFPGRTQTDLYLWLCRNRRELEARYGHHVLMKEAADDLSERFGGSPFPMRQFKRAFARMSGAVVDRTTNWWRASRQALGRGTTTKQSRHGEE
jgi:hypothetical protein